MVSRPAKKATEATGRRLCHAGCQISFGVGALVDPDPDEVPGGTPAAGDGAGGRMKNGRLTPPSASGTWTTLAAAAAVEDLLASPGGSCANNMLRGPLLIAPPGPAPVPTRSMSVMRALQATSYLGPTKKLKHFAPVTQLGVIPKTNRDAGPIDPSAISTDALSEQALLLSLVPATLGKELAKAGLGKKEGKKGKKKSTIVDTRRI
ncbi:uncharacterized protein PAN0_008c3520 [Moesziomyces antarcticus]|uniref:Uncharacterized protein n=1 Tax=Pseudozyma antarctica TaxID=84753 RepID=A0A081CF57_PSEA2|nr:uncharacterized protein PAN0_008c3520 [Moesziomyces antarcticus]GAK65303.1 hypothetical protein PAN0_008c3520 [Moesziomyces antarcticus]